MKKVTLSIFIAIAASTSMAKISQSCKDSLMPVVQSDRHIEELIYKVQISPERGVLHKNIVENTAETVALSCAGMKQLQLQKLNESSKKYNDKYAIIPYSEKYINKATDKVYSEAMAYYASLTDTCLNRAIRNSKKRLEEFISANESTLNESDIHAAQEDAQQLVRIEARSCIQVSSLQ